MYYARALQKKRNYKRRKKLGSIDNSRFMGVMIFIHLEIIGEEKSFDQLIKATVQSQ